MIRKRALRPNLTPMIDVVFLLLLFFLISTHMGRVQVTEFSAASAGAGVIQEETEPFLLEVGSTLKLNGRTVSFEALKEAVAGTDQLVAIRPDADVNVQELLQLVDQLKVANVERIVLVEGQ